MIEALEQFENPTDVALMQFLAKDKKKVYYHAKKAKLKINGFTNGSWFVVLLIPQIKIVESSPFIRDDFIIAYNEFLNRVGEQDLIKTVSIYKRLDKIVYAGFQGKQKRAAAIANDRRMV